MFIVVLSPFYSSLDIPYFNYESDERVSLNKEFTLNANANENNLFNVRKHNDNENTDRSAIPLSDGLLADCELKDTVYDESVLDILLLKVFRDLVRKEINFRSDVKGIKGLLAEGKHYYLRYFTMFKVIVTSLTMILLTI